MFISGGGRTLLNIHDLITSGELNAAIPLVVASRVCAGADRARERGLHTLVIPGNIGREELARLLAPLGIDYVVLAGYLKLLPIPPGFARRVINIHPALLPKFGGKGMYGHHVHEAVLAAGEKESGCTVHYCDSEFDRGEIILQARCPVYPTDTVDSLASRVFDLECRAYPAALKKVIGTRQ